MSSRTKALLAIVIASLLWGTAGTATKLLLETANPFVIATYRFAIASLLIFPFFLREKKPTMYLQKLIPLSLFAAGNIIFFYIGMTTTTASTTTLIYAGTPLITAILSKILIGESIGKRQFIGILVGLLGIGIIIFLPTIGTNQHVGNIQGNLFIVLAVLSWTLYTIGSRHFLAAKTFTPILMTAMNFFTTLAVSFGIALTTKQQFFLPTTFTISFVGILLYSGIFVTFITYLLFQWAVQRISATTASLKNYIEPIVGITLNTSLLGEQLSHGFLLGSILVFFGIVIVTGKRIIQRLFLYK